MIPLDTPCYLVQWNNGIPEHLVGEVVTVIGHNQCVCKCSHDDQPHPWFTLYAIRHSNGSLACIRWENLLKPIIPPDPVDNTDNQNPVKAALTSFTM
jgi:hypothetical protein